MAEPPITPRNLTARAAHRVAGNPATSRPEDAVANCFPGLELDVRNLDRRFFPGLVFDFVARDDIYADYTQPHRYGARLAYIDVANDPDVAGPSELATALLAALQGGAGNLMATGEWYLEWLQQDGHRIPMSAIGPDGHERPLDGLYVWRIVRGLEPLERDGADPPQPLTIGLRCRSEGRQTEHVELHGWRRRFVDPRTGVIDLAYQPGELMQSLCSPWQHDFRDCGCHYWASNHPDVVTGAVRPGEARLPDGAAVDPILANTPLDWLRSDRRREAAGAMGNDVVVNRPFQYDHYQINHTWEELAVVIGGTEIDAVYTPPSDVTLPPYDSPEQLVAVIRDQLAPVELTLALEYLYARSAIVDPATLPADAPSTLAGDAVFARHFMLLTATSEMQHVRLSNQILWTLFDAGIVPEPPYTPVLTPSQRVPAPTRDGGWRAAELRPLTLAALDDFIAIEHPQAPLDDSWSRVVSTLRLGGYPEHLAELALRVAKDGNDHYSRLREIRTVLRSTYGDTTPERWLRPLRPATAMQGADALAAYHVVLDRLRAAYDRQVHGHVERSGPLIVEARAAMDQLLAISEQLASIGLGVPYWTP